MLMSDDLEYEKERRRKRLRNESVDDEPVKKKRKDRLKPYDRRERQFDWRTIANGKEHEHDDYCVCEECISSADD